MFIKNRAISALLLLASAAFVLKADAVIATAKVSVNVIQQSSFSVSKQIILSAPAEKDNNSQQRQKYHNPVEKSSFRNKTPVKVKVNGDQNTIYDLSMSSKSMLTGSSSSGTITINEIKVSNNPTSIISNDELDVKIEGILSRPEGRSSDSYFGTTEITINFN